MSSLFHLEHEKQYLSALIRNPALRADTTHISERDFSETHRPIMGVIDAILATGGPDALNRFVVVERLNAMSLKIGHAIEPGVYINAISLIEVNDTAAIEIAKQLKRTTVRRELHDTCMRMAQRAADDSGERSKKTALDLVAEATAAFNGKVNVLGGTGEEEPALLYGTIDAFLDRETLFETRSVATEFDLFNDWYGHLDPGSLFVLVSRSKVGKSTWLQSMLQQIAMADKEDSFRALILDTELSLEEVQARIISSLTQIPEFYIRHKHFKKSREMRDKVDAAREIIRPLFAKVSHVSISGKPLEEQLSISRRWYHKHIHGTNRKCLIALDYFKLGARQDFRSEKSLSITIGEKADEFKSLAKELNVPVFAFCQANREAEDTKAGGRLSNSSVVAGSDMITQFCSNAFLLERMSPEERIQFGLTDEKSPTHALKAIVTRQLGPNEKGRMGFVKYMDDRGKPRYCENHLLYRFDKFFVTECGDLRGVVERNRISAVPVQAPVAAMDDGGKIL